MTLHSEEREHPRMQTYEEKPMSVNRQCCQLGRNPLSPGKDPCKVEGKLEVIFVGLFSGNSND